MSSDKLEPCPFCGDKDALIIELDDRNQQARCQECGARGPVQELDFEVIAAWNTRTSPSPSRMREALEQIDDRVNNEGDDSQACVSDIGYVARKALSAPEQAGAGEPCDKCGGHPTIKCLYCRVAPVADEGSEDEKRVLNGIGFNAMRDCEILTAMVRRLQASLKENREALAVEFEKDSVAYKKIKAERDTLKADNARLRGFHEECVKAREEGKREAFREAGQAIKAGLVLIPRLTERENELLSRIADAYLAYGTAALTATKEGA